MFNESYTGPKRADLNLAAASVRFVPAVGFLMTLQLQGKIDTHPSTFDQQSYYVWGIDRGSPFAVTPFPSRPDLGFDATVTVSVLRGGTSVAVQDLVRSDSSVKVFLPSKNVKVVGNKVQAIVPLYYLQIPDQGLPISQWLYSALASSSLDTSTQASGGSFIASFIPETEETPIGVPRGFTG
jgi:hypothetical protein